MRAFVEKAASAREDGSALPFATVLQETDSPNQRSRDAILRIGATEEGTLRRHVQTPQGPRDTVYFSILDSEWPAVRKDLEAKLGRPFPS